VWECGVYRGGTALLLAWAIRDNRPGEWLWLFDTFGGMPDADPSRDSHKSGDFSDTSAGAVGALLGGICNNALQVGKIPETFAGHEDSRIAFAHVDVDLYSSTLAALGFIVPRLVPGGILVCDDYGFASCPGATLAVDEYAAKRGVSVLDLRTGQAVIINAGTE
jgi:O-methyltransferase